MEDYNYLRPHDALTGMAPLSFAQKKQLEVVVAQLEQTLYFYPVLKTGSRQVSNMG